MRSASVFVREFGIPEYDAKVITTSKELAHFYEDVVAHSGNEPKLAANWVMGDVLRCLKDSENEIKDAPISGKQLGSLIQLITKGDISSKIAKTVFEEMWSSGNDPSQIVKEKGLKQVSDSSAIEAVVKKVIDSNPNQVEQYRGGKEKLLGFFVGQVMKKTKGKANPALVNKTVLALLKK